MQNPMKNRTMSLLIQTHSIRITILVLIILPLTSVLSYHSNHLQKRLSPYPHSFLANGTSKRASDRLFKNLIGDDGRVYACSGKNFFSFESNGSIAWRIHLNYTCNPNIAPVHGGSTKIYLVAENRVLKVYPLKIGTSEGAVEVFFGQWQGTEGGGEIIGISASVSTSCVLITVKNRGLFAYRLHGQLLWSAGPVLYQHGYRQGCRKNITACYFTSPPVIDQCEASIFICNTVGEIYSLSVRGPYFKWIQDLSSYGSTFIITSGNNGRLYVTVPDTDVVLALDVLTGSILWQRSIGHLSSADYEPVVDSNGWISFGSLDGFLYSFSPTGELRKFPKSAGLNSVIQVNPVLDCSGYGVYVSRTEMEGKVSQTIAEYTHVSALKPKSVVFTLLVPASGSVYSSESDPGKFLFKLSQSDLQHFVMDERTLLAFFAVSRKPKGLPCRSTRQKLASTCSQAKPDNNISIYTGHERKIVLFLLIESVILVLLVAVVQRCCVFWKKKKLQGLNLGKFLEKRRSLRSQKRAFDRMITELEQKANTEEAVANEVLEKLSDLVKEREGIKRKLSTTYSLGRDGAKSRTNSLLPSYSIRGFKEESVTIFQTLSESSTSEEEYYYSSSPLKETDDLGSEDEDSFAKANAKAKGKGKALVEVESSSDDEREYSSATSSASRGFVKTPLLLGHSFSDLEEVKLNDDEKDMASRSLRRRTVSFTG